MASSSTRSAIRRRRRMRGLGFWSLLICFGVICFGLDPAAGRVPGTSTENRARSVATSGHPVQVLRRVFRELADVAVDLELRRDAPRRDHLAAAHRFEAFERRVPELELAARTGFSALRTAVEREQKRLHDRRERVARSLRRWESFRKLRRNAGDRGGPRARRARRFGELLFTEIRLRKDSSLRARLERLRLRQRQVDIVLADLDAAEQRAIAFFRRMRNSLPRAIAILRSQAGVKAEVLARALSSEGRGPREIVKLIDRVQSALKKTLERHVESLESIVAAAAPVPVPNAKAAGKTPSTVRAELLQLRSRIENKKSKASK